MSELAKLADRLRDLADSGGHISTNVEQSAGRLRSLEGEVAAIARLGVDVRGVSGALSAAESAARSAAQAVQTVRQQGMSWADQLALSAVGRSTAAGVGYRQSESPASASGSETRRPLAEQRSSESDWQQGSGGNGSGDGLPSAAFTSPEGWANKVNGGGMGVPGRSNNCVDCARSVESTWRGDPTQAAAMRDDNALGTSASLVTDWAGGQLRPTTYAQLESDLLADGPGSSAIVVSTWRDGRGGHAYNAINDDGVIKFVDGQSGTTSRWPPSSWSESDTGMTWAVRIASNGQARD